MELSHIHLAVISKVITQYLIGMQINEILSISKNQFDQKNPTCLSRGYSPLSGIYGHTTVYNSAMHSFYVYGGVSYSAGRVQVSNALFVLHYPTRRWSVVSTGCHKNTEKCIFSGFITKAHSLSKQCRGTFINDVPYQGRQGGPRKPQKRDVIEQNKVGRQVKNGQKYGTSLMDVPQCRLSQFFFESDVSIHISCGHVVRDFESAAKTRQNF